MGGILLAETMGVFEGFGTRCFDDRMMRQRLPQDVYENLRRIRDEGQRWDPQVADAVADAMPQYPVDQAFETEIPEELRPHFDRWKARRAELKDAPRPRW